MGVAASHGAIEGACRRARFPHDTSVDMMADLKVIRWAPVLELFCNSQSPEVGPAS